MERRAIATGPGLRAAAVLLATAALPLANAHDHHESNIEEGKTISDDPIDTTLWVHIFIQMVGWGVVFPLGMVLGIAKSRWHVPLQVFGVVLAIVGYFLGHAHGGREFNEHNAHSKFVKPLSFLLFLQVVFGVYLKLHIERGIWGKIRSVVRIGHSIVGKLMPLLAWVQMLFGGITALGFCQNGFAAGCATHFIMGSAFIAYGVVLTLILLVGQLWLRRVNKSQEFFDSVVIAACGCVNTFTQYGWGASMGGDHDWEHTATGIIWWCAGLAGIWLSKDRQGRPQRNFIPGLVFVITGWAMGNHEQDHEASIVVHDVFGYTVMAAGIARIVEVTFIAKSQASADEEAEPVVNSFQYLPTFLLYASGFLFLGASDEQLQLVTLAGMDHVAYVLLQFSLAFMVFLFVLMLVAVYDWCVGDTGGTGAPAAKNSSSHGRSGPRTNGNVAVRDAQEFELEGLMSDDDDDEEDEETRHKRRQRGPASPYMDVHANGESGR